MHACTHTFEAHLDDEESRREDIEATARTGDQPPLGWWRFGRPKLGVKDLQGGVVVGAREEVARRSEVNCHPHAEKPQRAEAQASRQRVHTHNIACRQRTFA